MDTNENGHVSAQEAEHASLKYQIQNLINNESHFKEYVQIFE